jgi:hypothetical protein
METPRGDIDRLREALAKEAGLETLATDPILLPRVQTILRKRTLDGHRRHPH